ncbi:MAG: CopG family ribbon-helix-helix protein [Candidatus Bathyarchaeota archaeon]|nr:MAG: CopG family ribbon-helix-helix protein [Candidatus Bathyarchaeota archaeon]
MGTVNVSLPGEMVKKMDRIIKEESYASRSELVRDALRGLFGEVSWKSRSEGVSLAVVTMSFNIEGKGTLNEVGRTEHRYEHLILTSLHNHMGKNCLEIILARGTAEDIKELIRQLRAIRGVETIRVTVV